MIKGENESEPGTIWSISFWFTPKFINHELPLTERVEPHVYAMGGICPTGLALGSDQHLMYQEFD